MRLNVSGSVCVSVLSASDMPCVSLAQQAVCIMLWPGLLCLTIKLQCQCHLRWTKAQRFVPAGLRLSNLDVKALQAIFELLQVRAGVQYLYLACCGQ